MIDNEFPVVLCRPFDFRSAPVAILSARSDLLIENKAMDVNQSRLRCDGMLRGLLYKVPVICFRHRSNRFSCKRSSTVTPVVVHFTELALCSSGIICTSGNCASSPLPWRSCRKLKSAMDVKALVVRIADLRTSCPASYNSGASGYGADDLGESLRLFLTQDWQDDADLWDCRRVRSRCCTPASPQTA